MWAVRGRAHPWGEANPEGDETWRQLLEVFSFVEVMLSPASFLLLNLQM